MSDDEPEDLIGESDEGLENEATFLAGWRESAKRYRKINT
jgi:hypothetical protein